VEPPASADREKDVVMESSSNSVPCDLLKGCTIVLSGVMSLIGREKLEQFIVSHGGNCTNSVSGKTTYLVIGKMLEDGREATQGNKYKTAIQKGTSVLSEE
jgi:BRCT domain type II-containing protein